MSVPAIPAPAAAPAQSQQQANAAPSKAPAEAAPAEAKKIELPELTPEQEDEIFNRRLKNHKFKVKDGDKDVELGTDEILRGFRMRRDSDKRFEEAAKYRKQAEQLAELLEKDPWEAMRRLGKDPDALAVERILGRMQFDEMTPDQKIAYHERMQREQLQRQLDEYRQKEEMTAKERQVAEARQRIENEFVSALEEAKVPRTATLVKRMAEVKFAYAQKGADVPAKDCLAIAIDSLREEHAAMYGEMEPEFITKLFPTVAERLRKAELAKVQGQAAAPKPPKQAGASAKQEPKKYVTEREWEEYAKSQGRRR